MEMSRHTGVRRRGGGEEEGGWLRVPVADVLQYLMGRGDAGGKRVGRASGEGPVRVAWGCCVHPVEVCSIR